MAPLMVRFLLRGGLEAASCDSHFAAESDNDRVLMSGSLFDARPSAPKLLKRTERHPPGSQLVVPTCPRNCPQFLKDGLRIRRANTQVIGNLQICARNRIEGESITTITVAVESERLCLLRQPAVDPPRGRLSGDEPTIALVTPPRSGKGAPKSLDSHSIERKASFAAVSIPLPWHVMSVRAFPSS